MLSFFIVFTILISTASCGTQWDCPFRDKDYGVDRPTNHFGPVYGTPVTPMKFESINEFQEFSAKLEEVRKNVFDNFLLDDLGELVKFNKAFLKAPGYISVVTFSTFYVPDIESRQDNLGLTMKVFNTISADDTWNRVKDHWFIAGSAKEFFNTSEIEENTSNPDQPFVPDRITGLITFSVNNMIGHMIIDMQNAVSPIPIVMLDNKILETDRGKMLAGFQRKYKSLGTTIVYLMVDRGEDAVIQSFHLRKNQENRDETILEEAILTTKTLCSFVETQNNFIYTSNDRFVTKISADDGFSKAFVIVNLYNRSIPTFSVGYRVSPSDEEYVDFETVHELLKDSTSEEEEANNIQNIFDRACQIMELEGEKKELLLKNLLAVEHIMPSRKHFPLEITTG